MNKFSIIILSICLFALNIFSAKAQTTGLLEAGIEIQAYPTGLIPGVHLDVALGEKGSIYTRLGYNIVRHRDLGVHEDERGGGFGGSLGYRYYLNETRLGWFGGVRCDVWLNSVDWKDNIDLPTEVSGTTEVTVLQPTAEVGYAMSIMSAGEKMVFSPALAFGREINVKTDGAEVGQDFILLGGFRVSYRF